MNNRSKGCGTSGLRAATRASLAVAALVLALVAEAATPASPGAATPPIVEPAPPVVSARGEVPFDLTGDWVSVVTEDWRLRMVVPGRGEYAGLPLNVKAKVAADAWDPASDEAAGQSCKAYGAPVVMREPERVRISWLDENTLQVETDAGQQLRTLHFQPAREEPAASLQGWSAAKWVFHEAGPSFGAAVAQKGPRAGTLKIVTDHLSPGLLRKNGVPYGAGARVTEFWDVHQTPSGVQWLVITVKVEDPEFLRAPYYYSPNFRKEPDGSRWEPAACSLRW
jgi:hypothetical protein